jgi:hypothetical protein
MKVMCIKSSEVAYTRRGLITAPDHMKVHCGTLYTVIKEVPAYKGEMKYVLAEKPANCRYKKEYFAPLSEIDETERPQQYQKLNLQ